MCFFMTNQSWQVSGELEFEALMEDIDADMHQSQTPIPRREFEAIKLLRKRLGADHSLLLSDLPEKPQAGVYAGRDLTKRVFNWIEERYGDRLKINFGPGATAVSIRGDVYPVVLPFVMGRRAVSRASALESILVLIFELVRIETLRGKVEHILGDLLIRNVIEVVVFHPHLIGISQGDTEQSLTARFKGDDVLARRTAGNAPRPAGYRPVSRDFLDA